MAGTNWGLHKETIMTTYKAQIWSVISNAATVWFPIVSTTSNKNFQIIQNTAATIANGSHLRASINHLHTETHLLRVKQSLGILCSKYLTSALRPKYTSFPLVSQQSSSTIKTQTLKTRFLPVVSPYLTNGTLDPTDYDNVIKDIHHQTVQMAILNQLPNSILQTSHQN